MAQAFGSDVTWGIVDVVGAALGCTPVNITPPDELLLDPPPAQRFVVDGAKRAIAGSFVSPRCVVSAG